MANTSFCLYVPHAFYAEYASIRHRLPDVGGAFPAPHNLKILFYDDAADGLDD